MKSLIILLNYNNIAKFEIERRNADPEQKKEIEFIIFFILQKYTMRKCFYLCVPFLQREIGIEFCRQIKTLEQGKTLNPQTKLKYAMN